MSKKKKIIFSTIAVILIVAIIVGIVLYSIFRRPTIEELFDKNRDYFNSLESLETEVVLDIESHRKNMSGEYHIIYDSTTTILSHFPSNTSFAQQNLEAMQNETELNTQKTIYRVNDEEYETYYNEIYLGADAGWVTDRTDRQLSGLMVSNDFGLIDSFSTSFNLEKELVEIDGVSCYKATAIIRRPSLITSYYTVNDMIGVFVDQFMEYSINATVYFREDTEIIYKIEYDLTDLQHEVFEMNQKYKLDSGNFNINVYFKQFNHSNKIVVPDEVKSVAGPYIGNEIEDPIDIDDENYELSGEHAVTLGQLARKYSEQYTITQYIIEVTDGIDAFNDVDFTEVIGVNRKAILAFEDKDGNKFNVTVKNCANEPMHYLDCYILKIDIASINCPDFNKFGIGKDLTTNSTIEDFKNVLGRYTHEFDNGNEIEYTWRSYIDYCQIHIRISKETGKVTSFCIDSFDISYYLNK